MSVRKKERNKGGGGAGGGGKMLTSKVAFGINRLAHPSVGRFKTSRVPPSLDEKKTRLEIKSIVSASVAECFAPECNFGSFNTKVLERLLKETCSPK